MIIGRDVGEHEDQPLRAVDDELRAGPFALFIDARDTRRDRLQSIHMLTGSRFAELGDTMRIYTDGAACDEALQLAAPALSPPRPRSGPRAARRPVAG